MKFTRGDNLEILLILLFVLPLIGLLTAGLDVIGAPDEETLPYFEREKHERLNPIPQGAGHRSVNTER